MTMKKIISVYIIFAFLLTSFAGCGKLKNIVGLSQPEALIPPKVDSQPDTSAPPEVNNQSETSTPPEVVNQPEASISSETVSQSDTSASPEVDSQPDTSASPEVNSQPEAPAPPEVDSQPDTSASSEVNNQPEAPSDIGAKDLTKKESWNEWTERNWGRLCGVEVAFVGTALIVAGIYHYFKPAAPLRSPPPTRIPSFEEVRSASVMNRMPLAFNGDPSRINLRGSIQRIVIDPSIDYA